MHFLIAQLEKLFPGLLQAISRGVVTGYAEMVRIFTIERLNSPMFEKKFLDEVEPFVGEAVENEIKILGASGTNVYVRDNCNNGHRHIEIYAGEFVLTCSSADSPNACPREAKFRRNLASGQTMLPGVFSYAAWTRYLIVTHFRRAGTFAPECVKIGVPDETGKSWASRPVLIKQLPDMQERIAENTPAAKEEKIQRTAKPKLK